MLNIWGELSGENVLPKTGGELSGGSIQGELSYTPPSRSTSYLTVLPPNE